MQTILGRYLRQRKDASASRERLELPDGDFLDTYHVPADGPVVLLLHGLGGTFHSGYAQGLLSQIAHSGWYGVFLQMRGFGTEPNRLPRFYHACAIEDVQFVVDHLKDQFPDRPLYVVGYSLGGNILLRLLAEHGADSPIDAAVAVSVPFDLQDAVARLDRGFSRVYQWSLLNLLKQSVRNKFKHQPAPFDLQRVLQARDFFTFDNLLTAPLHGFKSALEYYRQCGCRPVLKAIRTPTLIIHAKDDPFMTVRALPKAEELSPSIELQLSDHGGHVGFFDLHGFAPRFLLERWIMEYLHRRAGTPFAGLLLVRK